MLIVTSIERKNSIYLSSSPKPLLNTVPKKGGLGEMLLHIAKRRHWKFARRSLDLVHALEMHRQVMRIRRQMAVSE